MGGCRAEAAHAFPFSHGRVSRPRSTDTAIRLRYAAKERADLLGPCFVKLDALDPLHATIEEFAADGYTPVEAN